MSITAEEFDDFDDHDEGGLSGFYVLAIFLTLLAAFLVVVYFAYQRGAASVTMADADLPVVAADPRPIKEEVPLTMGTTERREVYDQLAGVAPTTVIADTRPGRDPMDGYASGPTAPAAPATTRTPAEAPASAPVVAAAAEPEPKPAPVAAKPKPAAPVVAAAPTPAPTPAPAAAVPGTHVVQVGAFGSNDEAMRFYQTLGGKMGALVTEKSPDVQVAEVKGKTYHRLRLAPFSSYSAANDYCTSLKGKGQDCLVKGV